MNPWRHGSVPVEGVEVGVNEMLVLTDVGDGDIFSGCMCIWDNDLFTSVGVAVEGRDVTIDSGVDFPDDVEEAVFF